MATTETVATPGSPLVHPRLGVPVVAGLATFARSSPVGAVAACYLLAVLLVAIFADVVAPYNPLLGSLVNSAKPPMPGHPLGTDQLGRDLLSRLIYGTRITLVVGVTSVVLSNSIGLMWGVAAGYLGGRFDLLSQRLIE